MNDAIRNGLKEQRLKRRPFRQRTVSLGEQLFSGDKALAFAFDLEDRETLKKMGLDH